MEVSIGQPRRHRSVGVGNPFVIAGFRFVPALFDVLVGPLMRLAALSDRRPGAYRRQRLRAPPGT